MILWLKQIEENRRKHQEAELDSKRYSLECKREEFEEDKDYEARKERIYSIAIDRYMRDKGVSKTEAKKAIDSMKTKH